ncbi:MAG TPA: hypothetical protein VEZ90_14270, partial [Blastocatellia bacterium]|nr:hypothetical protein [Blastocatellia bacterium]
NSERPLMKRTVSKKRIAGEARFEKTGTAISSRSQPLRSGRIATVRAKPAEPLESSGRAELSDQEADWMVTQALDCDLPAPEPFVRVLLFLFDLNEQARGPELSDSLHRLMTAAYNNSNVHSANLDAYLEAVRGGVSYFGDDA